MSDTVNACLLDGKGAASNIAISSIDCGAATDGVLWLHLDINDPQHVNWLKQSSKIDPLILDALLAEETRPRTTTIGDGLLMALRGVNLTPGAEPDDMVSIRLWVTQGCIISTRRRNLLSVSDIMERLEAGHGPLNASEFLVDLIDGLVWRMSSTVDNLEDLVADLEGRGLEGGSSELRFELATLRRQAITLRRYLAPQREALGRLIIEKVSWIDDNHRLRLREVGDRLTRHIEDLDAVRERASVTQEELMGRLSEQMNKRMYVLSIAAAIFLPLGFLTGLLGVNLGGIPGAESSLAFWVFVIMIIAVVVIMTILFRWKRWL